MKQTAAVWTDNQPNEQSVLKEFPYWTLAGFFPSPSASIYIYMYMYMYMYIYIYVCVCVCVRVYVVYEDTNLYNDMGMTEVLQFEGGL